MIMIILGTLTFGIYYLKKINNNETEIKQIMDKMELEHKQKVFEIETVYKERMNKYLMITSKLMI